MQIICYLYERFESPSAEQKNGSQMQLEVYESVYILKNKNLLNSHLLVTSNCYVDYVYYMLCVTLRYYFIGDLLYSRAMWF